MSSESAATPRPLNASAVRSSLERVCEGYEPLRGQGHRTGPFLESAITSLYRMWIRPGDRACDLGAHTGAHTIPLAEAVGTDGEVIAFEVLPTCIERLQSNLQHAGLRDRVTLVTKAVGKEAGRMTFHEVESDPGLSGLRRRQGDDESTKTREFEVEVVRLDDVPEVDQRLDFIKADLEGGEFHALLGAEQTLIRSRPLIAFESALPFAAKTYGYALSDWFRFLERVGYGLTDILGCPMTETLIERHYPHYAVAYPLEQELAAMRALRIASLECALDARRTEEPGS